MEGGRERILRAVKLDLGCKGRICCGFPGGAWSESVRSGGCLMLVCLLTRQGSSVCSEDHDAENLGAQSWDLEKVSK